MKARACAVLLFAAFLFTACDRSASALTSEDQSVLVLPRFASGTVVPSVLRLEVTLSATGRADTALNVAYSKGTSLQLGRVPSNSAFSVTMEGYDSVLGSRVDRWVGSGSGIAGNSATQSVDISTDSGPAAPIATIGSSVVPGTLTFAAPVWYTTDGSDPRVNGTAVTGTVAVSSACTLKAAAKTTSGGKALWSAVSSWVFTSSASKVTPAYTLTTSASNGTITLMPSGGTYDSGTKVIATATPNTGYAFSGWSGASKSTSSICTVTVTANTTLMASFMASSSVTTGDSGQFTDSRDNQSYKYVKIGTQTWMAQNLNYAGTASSTGVCYSNLTSNCSKYGRLYTWSVVMAGSSSSTSSPSGVQGICPSGWHVPSNTEWGTLIAKVGSDSACSKLSSTSGWSSSSGSNGTDLYGFDALPAGAYLATGSFSNVGSEALFWSSSGYDASYALSRTFTINDAGVVQYYGLKANGFSLRCVMN